MATLLCLTACQSDDEVQDTTGTIQLQLDNMLPYMELITRAEATVADLTTKYKALMVRCGKLEKQLAEYSGTSIGMATEEVT